MTCGIGRALGRTGVIFKAPGFLLGGPSRILLISPGPFSRLCLPNSPSVPLPPSAFSGPWFPGGRVNWEQLGPPARLPACCAPRL